MKIDLIPVNDKGMIGPDDKSLKDEDGEKSLAEMLAAGKEKDRELDKERRDDSGDKYDFHAVVQKLYDSIVREEIAPEEQMKKLDTLSKKSLLFFAEYDKILKRHLPEGKEEEAVKLAFKNIIGEVAYSLDKASSKAETLGAYPQIQNALPGVYRGHAIHYSDKGIGFMKREEAEKSNRERQARDDRRRLATTQQGKKRVS
jgi:hypothetical protein